MATRDIEKLQVAVQGRQGSIDAANAGKQQAEAQLSTLLPAQKASAESELTQAEVELSKTVVRAGTEGRIEQFTLRVGDVVNPLMRPAGVLIPEGAGRGRLQAGFGQVEAQVLEVGMVAEAACASRPWKVIPMVVTGVQDYIAAGQLRSGEQLVDAQQVTRAGTILAFLEPLYDGGFEGVTPGSSCIVNLYSSHHDEIESPKTQHHARNRSPRGGCRRACARHDPANPGADLSHSDPRSFRRTLTSTSARNVVARARQITGISVLAPAKRVAL